MNLEKRYWCYQACPIGTLYDCQACIGGRPKRLRWLGYLALAALAFTAVSYFKLDSDLGSEGKAIQDWYTYFFKNRYSVSLTVIGVAGGLVAVAYRLRRSFCSALCPIGTFSDLVLRLERSLHKRGAFDG
jgi:polyferredoxin